MGKTHYLHAIILAQGDPTFEMHQVVNAFNLVDNPIPYTLLFYGYTAQELTVWPNPHFLWRIHKGGLVWDRAEKQHRLVS